MNEESKIVTLDVGDLFWERVYTVAPLVLIGTREPSGAYNLAPKHMVTPVGWESYWGFVCTPRHSTYHNVLREETFRTAFSIPLPRGFKR